MKKLVILLVVLLALVLAFGISGCGDAESSEPTPTGTYMPRPSPSWLVLGSISIASTPSGASIYLDGSTNSVGTTPYNSWIFGSHTIDLRMPGYQSCQGKVDVEPGENVDFSCTMRIEPLPNPGSISVSSYPSGASIFLDGAPDSVGATPYYLTDISPGQHTIRLTLAGYAEWNGTVTVESAQIAYVGCGLTTLPKGAEGCGDEIRTDITDYTGKIGVNDYLVYTIPGSSIMLVCQQPCPMSKTFMVSKYIGLQRAIDQLTYIVGIDFPRAPIETHFTSDSACGNFQPGATGTSGLSSEGRGQICTWDYEKSNLIVPFDEDNACRIAQQFLSVHEAVHQLFEGTGVSYWAQEYFAKMLSFYISGYWMGGDVNQDSSFEFGISPCDQRMESFAPLPYQLCKLYGVGVDSYRQIFTQMDAQRRLGRNVDTRVFKEIIDTVTGQDTSEAFQISGISF